MRDACREAEIDHLDSLFGFVKEDVFELDVSVGDITLMAVVNALDDLAPEELSLELWHLSVWFHLKVAV